MAQIKRNFQACHIVTRLSQGLSLQSFQARGKAFQRVKEIQAGEQDAFPRVRYDKTWRDTFTSKLSIALLPGAEVFFRVLNLPTTEISEIAGMVELQIERISPLPPNQIFWTWEVLPSNPISSRSGTTVLVSLVEQKYLHQFSNDLESRHFYADRIAPDNLTALIRIPVQPELVRIYASQRGNRHEALVQWWVDGQLHHISQLLESSLERLISLVDQEIRQTFWAGQMDGWVDQLPPIEVETQTEQHALWAGLKEMLGIEKLAYSQPPTHHESTARLAELFGHGLLTTDLAPPELKKAYRNRQIDSLWMTCLGWMAMAYLAGLGVYFFMLHQAKAERQGMKNQIAALSGTYTNALKLDERIRITENQLNLRFAALDSWKAVVEVLPEALEFKQFKFSKGEILNLSGQGPVGQNNLVNAYVDALSALTDNKGKKLFTEVQSKNINNIRGSMTWTIDCILPE